MLKISASPEFFKWVHTLLIEKDGDDISLAFIDIGKENLVDFIDYNLFVDIVDTLPTES